MLTNTVRAIRVILADDSNVIRRAVRRILDEESGVEVIGEAATISETVRLLALTPDVAVVDLHMLDASLASVLASANPKTCVVIMSALISGESLEFARKFGINEVLEKCDLGATLVPAINKVLNGRNHCQKVKTTGAS
jgi:two-component system response regulator DevR